MKRIVLVLFTAIIAFSSCENIEDNSPAMQGMIDSLFFKANEVRAVKNEDGSYTLQGVNQDEILTLQIDRAQLGTYNLGSGSASFATYEDANGNVYTTSPSGNGTIELTDRCISCGLLTGTFQFTAIQEGIDSITVNRGFFFEANFLTGQIYQDENQNNDGTMIAKLNGEVFEANTVVASDNGVTIRVEGAIGEQVIAISVPSDALPGNYPVSAPGFGATFSIQGEEDVTSSGQMSINFNNTSTRKLRVFFRFETDANSITEGDLFVNY
ncbi:MAG: hypothetical protein HKN48_13185 [Flavobacteriaceae bacterium]|nr:hypothetical protein [Flavobacteriaceae bacterium]